MEDERLLTDEEMVTAIQVGWLPFEEESMTHDQLLTLRYQSIAKAQLVKADKARPADREKIADWLITTYYSPSGFRGGIVADGKVFLEQADQILSLLNPEAIRREVAEEIIKEAEDGGYVILLESGQALVASTFGEYWQSLKSRLGVK